MKLRRREIALAIEELEDRTLMSVLTGTDLRSLGSGRGGWGE